MTRVPESAKYLALLHEREELREEIKKLKSVIKENTKFLENLLKTIEKESNYESKRST